MGAAKVAITLDPRVLEIVDRCELRNRHRDGDHEPGPARRIPFGSARPSWLRGPSQRTRAIRAVVLAITRFRTVGSVPAELDSVPGPPVLTDPIPEPALLS